MGNYLKVIAMTIVLLFLITFGVENSQTIRLHYYLDTIDYQLPVYLLVLICLLIGMVIGMIIGVRNRLNLRRANKILERENRDMKMKTAREKEETTEEA